MAKKKKLQFSESERHAIAHAQWMVDQATDDRNEVRFDYQLVQTLLSLIVRLKAYAHR